MKNLSYAAPSYHSTAMLPGIVSLYQLVNRLQIGLLPQAVEKKTFIVNDVDKTLMIPADENMLAFIIGGLMTNAVNSTRDGCIRIEAIPEENAIQVRVRNNGVFFYNAKCHGLGDVAEVAQKLGGTINIYNKKHEGMVAIFSLSTKKIA